MGVTPRLVLDSAQRETLQRWAHGRRIPYRLVIRSRIVLYAATGRTNRQISRELGVSPLTVACWRSRFALLGIDGISRDAPRVGSRRALPEAKLREVLLTTVQRPPPKGPKWSSRSVARAVGVSHSTVLRIWRTHPTLKDRTRLSALAHDPRFQPRSIDVSGVYLSPPRSAVVISDTMPTLSHSGTSFGTLSPSASRPSHRASSDSTGELVELLARVESVPTARSSARLARKEFLAFLGSVAHHAARGARSHLLLTPADESLRSTVVKWNSPTHEMTVVDPRSSDSLHELVARWLSELSQHPRTEIALQQLPRLRQAVDRWTAEPNGAVRPFAWVHGRPP